VVLFNIVAILFQKVHHIVDHSDISWNIARHICFRVVAKRAGANIFGSGFLSKKYTYIQNGGPLALEEFRSLVLIQFTE